MTVASEVNRAGPYTGNGVTTVFAYGFRILDAAHIKVIRTEAGVDTTLTLTVDYTVTGVGATGGGSITTTVAPTATQTITILRSVPFTQNTALVNQGPFYAETVEAGFDLAVMRDQQSGEILNRAIRFPGSNSIFGGELASINTRKNRLLGFDDSGALIYPLGPNFVNSTYTSAAYVDSRATAVATTFPVSVNIIRTGGYATPGDGGAAHYKRSIGPAGIDKFQSADSAWWQLSEPILFPQMFGAFGNGAADDTTALQSALTTASGKTLFIPQGIYKITAPLNLPDAPISIFGAGMGISVIRWTVAVVSGLSATYSAITSQLNVENLTLQTGVAGGGIALSATWPVTLSWTKVTASLRNIEIAPATLATNYWNTGIQLDYGWNAVIDNPHIRGADNSVLMSAGINLLDRSNDVCIKDPHIFFGAVGIQTGSLCEGTTVSNPRIVYVNYGVYSAPATDAPYLAVYGGHIGALIGGIVATNRSQSHFFNNTIYKRAEATSSFAFIQLTTCDEPKVHHNEFVVLGGATGSAVGVNVASGARSQVNFNVTNGADTCVQFGAGSSDYTAVGNRRVGGTSTLVASGTGATVLRDNLPADTNGLQTFAVNAATPDVSNAATGTFFTANSLATTVTNFLNGYAGQIVNIIANDANTTVQHNANVNLQGGVSFVMGAAAILTLKKADIWREVSRRTA